MKKTFLLIIIILLIPNIIAQEEDQQQSQISSFEQIVVKEHFQTKQELKDYIDKKSLEYQRDTDQKIGNSFEEIDYMINTKVMFILFKIVGTIISSFLFAGVLWYFIRVKLDKRYNKIRSLRKRIKKLEEGYIPIPLPKNYGNGKQTEER